MATHAPQSARVHPSAVKYDRLWERLLEDLNGWASAREVPGGIEVTFEQSPGMTRTVEIVVTLADWDDYVSTLYGTGDPRATSLKRNLLATPAGIPYLVYRMYDWEPSKTRELAEDDIRNPGPGEWVVMDDNGNVVERFADFEDQD